VRQQLVFEGSLGMTSDVAINNGGGRLRRRFVVIRAYGRIHECIQGFDHHQVPETHKI
jgi:hypothetical protein